MRIPIANNVFIRVCE